MDNEGKTKRLGTFGSHFSISSSDISKLAWTFATSSFSSKRSMSLRLALRLCLQVEYGFVGES